MKTITTIVLMAILMAAAILILTSCDRSQNDSWIWPEECHNRDCFEKASAGSIIGSPGDYREPGDYP